MSSAETPATERVRIYQLFVRQFSNTNETRKANGTLAENGVGKFNQINDRALGSLRDLGFTHLWLTGVLQQATATAYEEINQPADDPDLLKGLAGSPYAIKDYFDVCPDYAVNPKERLAEFKSLLERIHRHEMKALLDLVPNHVARSYGSDVMPDLDFGRKGCDGKGDNSGVFFDPQNNFFYLKPGTGGPPLRLPTVKDGKPVSPTCQLPGVVCDGYFAPEKEHGRVTGNNQPSWQPDLNDWYETVKLNYGFDFSAPKKDVREYPTSLTPAKAIPDTWKKMDRVIAYWQSLGVDGFRCDMAHMVPAEFWQWAIAQARLRNPAVFFLAEAYNNDPGKVPATNPELTDESGNVMFGLLQAGFDAVYDDPTYKALKKIYDGPGWANDIDDARPNEFIFERSLRYAENHDEVRLAAAQQWGGVGQQAGPAICAILYGLSRGPVMVYNGQEVGEPGAGVEGFGADDSRTSIFDYWSMPEVVKWVNGHDYDGGKLSDAQKTLRESYGRLLRLIGAPAFRDGTFIPLNPVNRSNPKYGRVGNEQPSGHWLYSFLRYDAKSGARFLVTVNLNASETLKDVTINFDKKIVDLLGLAATDPKTPIVLTDRLVNENPNTATSCLSESASSGIWIGDIPPLTAFYFEITL